VARERLEAASGLQVHGDGVGKINHMFLPVFLKLDYALAEARYANVIHDQSRLFASSCMISQVLFLL
jgi:hypothetical protein